MRTIEQMIQAEVLVCLSSLVSTLAKGSGYSASKADGICELMALAEQAFELSAPIADYEEAAIQAGWEEQEREEDGQHVFVDKTDGQTWCAADWEELCIAQDIEPYDREVFEHWAVTDWFADKLIAADEKVDKDFAGMCVWARTTSGQGIASDGVIERIYAELAK